MHRPFRYLLLIFGLAVALAAQGIHAAQEIPKAPTELKPEIRQHLDEMELWVKDANYQEALQAADRAIATAGVDELQQRGVLERIGRAAVTLYNSGNTEVGAQLFGRTVSILERVAPNSPELAARLSVCGQMAKARRDWATGDSYFTRAIHIFDRLGTASLDFAETLASAGDLSFYMGDLVAAQGRYERALSLYRDQGGKLAVIARLLENLGVVASNRREMAVAQDYYEQALKFQIEIQDNSLPVANLYDALGNVLKDRGALEEARKSILRGLEIREKLVPRSALVANSRMSLGLVAERVGDLDLAYRNHLQALEIYRNQPEPTVNTAACLSNLALVARSRGDIAGARSLFESAQKIYRETAPNSNAYVYGLSNLGSIVFEQGDLEYSERLHLEALELKKRFAPGSLDVAMSLNNLAQIAKDRNDLVRAQDLYQQSIAIKAEKAPGSLELARGYSNLALVSRRLGDNKQARLYFEKALEIRQRLAPDSLEVAETLSNLTILEVESGNKSRALTTATQAWSIVKRQARSVTGDESRQSFSTSTSGYAGNLQRVLLDQGRAADAFQVLEESRMQALLQLLADRGIARSSGDPACWKAYDVAKAALDLAGQRVSMAGQQQASLEGLIDKARKQSAFSPALPKLTAQLKEAESAFEAARKEQIARRVEMETAWTAIKSGLPQFLPSTPSIATLRRALPPGSVYLAFAPGESDTLLFVVPAGNAPVQGFRLEIAGKDLESLVNSVRRIEDPEAVDALEFGTARKLFQKLFPSKIRATLAKANRLFISPDGPLWELPFAALIVPGPSGTAKDERFLGLEKPITYTQSLTVYAHSIQERPGSHKGRQAVLVAGNPVFDPEKRVEWLSMLKKGIKTNNPLIPPGKPKVKGLASKAELALARPLPSNARRPLPSEARRPLPSEARRGWDDKTRANASGERRLAVRDGKIPPQLPAAEIEAELIGKLYGTVGAIRVTPTEKWFRQRCSNADVIHLATHGFLSSYLAANSGVILAVPDKLLPPEAEGATNDDGVLQAWEIYRLKLKAEVVVLSACETGLGAKVRGEGLVGLTRALQVAGARSVVASQWQVSDASTAVLMVKFHQGLRKGLAKDEALRLAMREVAYRPEAGEHKWSHPYYWAAFLHIGDPENRLPRR